MLTDRQKRARSARRLLAARGLVEAVTWSFLPKAQAEAFGAGATLVELANPISVDLAVMRPSLLPGLLTAVERNRNRGFADVALFELGQAYRGETPDDQFVAAAGVRAGTARVSGGGRHWDGRARTCPCSTPRPMRWRCSPRSGSMPRKAQITSDAPAWYHPGRSGTLRLGPKTVLAISARCIRARSRRSTWRLPWSAFEVFLDALPPEKRKSRAKAPLAQSDLLPVRRDFAFVLDGR